jgi:hypothetical protein
MGALETVCLSPWELCDRNLEGGPLAGDPEGYLGKVLETGISFHRGSALGNLEEGSSTGDFESWMQGLWGWGIALSRGSVERASGKAPLLGNLKDEVFSEICKMPCRWASLSTGALLGNLEGVRLTGLFREINSISEYIFEPRGHSGFKSE